MNRIVAALVAATAAVLLTSCSAQMGDRGGQEGAPPDRIADVDYVEVYRNADGFPNIARTCVLGLGFATPTTGWGVAGGSGGAGASGGATPFVRVPEWDTFCAGKASAR